jgi:2-dehydro-3-deoxyphosphogluconate aldolase/(4S)-4-hydroxy-2-oxoglutarate aldolase
MAAKDTLTRLLNDGFILVFNQDKLDVVRTAEALIQAGIHNMEVTCRIKRPLDKLSQLRGRLPDFVAGAASLIDQPEILRIFNQANPQDPLPSVRLAVEAGACYLVSAMNFSDRTYQAYSAQLPIIPGCSTVTEIVSQFAMGANLCKVFPAKELGGAEFIKAVDPAIHKTISMIPTGGTSAQNIPDYVEAGVLVFGGSFSMIDKAKMNMIVEQQDYGLLAAELAAIKQLIDTLRASKYRRIDITKASIEEISCATGRNFNCP